ncbi:hypothetical protein ALT_4629 [Aspergillus lentulus]|uniref:DNA-directed RNA polymerase I subunit RPA34.5 n=1 Tax=Aspergillus lentulus TaxID=293939 RepID=A0AAN4PJL3_ASPLE|nr:uncharacterized protein IFM58399_04559 [Aspergillus lentulus]KAF4154531.1 hypothetical protein CNMCM6069_009091 [Aspergillus lentulus]KAF4164880.1 hypothetical protein CNMCM6936_008564 [Aspergillus lentulus]KAF4174280.1 hypothetical protein CNMCM8060_008852 [Aspergillus lentulus]KAF4189211.1 hypothetical protein CNMCM7927_009212 [Aspergillus lentulus]KAF4195222.1 hypothetical protein CNMCM8694_006528 [Aspergillus lentulus]
MAPAKSIKKTASDSESSSSSRSTSPEPTKKSESDRDTEDSSSSGSESEDSASSDSESVPSSPKIKASNTSSTNDSLYPRPPYKPPSGFKAAKKQLPPSSTTSSLLSDLRGKQIFHITAPAFLPLSKVKEVSLAKILQGEPVLKHEGVQYGIPPENIGQGDLGGKSLLLYDSKTQTYYSAPATTMPTYHVQETINIPKSLGTDDAVLAAAQDQIKPPRKQPKHLKMRFRPVGSGDGPPETIGSSSEESEGEGKPAFKFPKESKTEREERKRKHAEEVEGSQSAGLPRKKSKKQSVDASQSSKKRDEKKRKKEKA